MLNNHPALHDLIRIYEMQLVERAMLDETKEEMKRLKGLVSLFTSKTG
jgi:hypothetical protein